MAERRPVEPRQRDGLLPGGLVARVDVDQGEGRLPGVGQAPGPGVDLEARLVAEPGERRDAVGDEVVVGVAVLASIDAGLVPAAEPGRGGGRDVLLPEAGRAGAVREPLEVERPIGQVREHRRGDPGEVADQLALGDRRIAVEQRLVEVGQLELVAADPPDALLAQGLEGFELGVGGAPGGVAASSLSSACAAVLPLVALAIRSSGSDGSAAFGRFGGSHRLCRGRDRRLRGGRWSGRGRLEALERGLADDAIARPTAELGADHELRPDPADVAQLAAPAAPVVRGGGGSNGGSSVSSDASRWRISLPRPAVEPGADLAGEPQAPRPRRRRRPRLRGRGRCPRRASSHRPRAPARAGS